MAKATLKVKNPWMFFTFIYLLALGITIVMDGLLIIPMVEVDPALQIEFRGSPLVAELRLVIPQILPLVLLLVFVSKSMYRLQKAHKRSYALDEDKIFLLTLPFRLGTYPLAGWVLVFLSTAVLDLASLYFPLATEAWVYYVSTALAMGSTGLFGFLISYLMIEEASRRLLIPLAFPSGGVSLVKGAKIFPFPIRLTLLWLATTLFPLMVLGLGLFTGDYVLENQTRAYSFIVIMVPLTFYLMHRTGLSVQEPLKELVKAVEKLSMGNFSLELRSRNNDELGYLQDRMVVMAKSLEEKVIMEEQFGRAVDPRVRDYLLSGEVPLGGTKMQAAVLFCDVRSFTTLSEELPEEVILRLLNEHLSASEECIRSHRGMINKFMGDGFLAVFGAPVPDPEASGNAFDAALAIMDANRRLNLERQKRGDPMFQLGIGIHKGPVIAGLVGSRSRSEYTVIGDTVNLASRIQNLSKTYPATLFITESVAQEQSPANKASLHSLGMVKVRGKKEAVRLFCLKEAR